MRERETGSESEIIFWNFVFHLPEWKNLPAKLKLFGYVTLMFS